MCVAPNQGKGKTMGLENPIDQNSQESKPKGALITITLEVKKAENRLRMMEDLVKRKSGLPEVIRTAGRLLDAKKYGIDFDIIQKLHSLKNL